MKSAEALDQQVVLIVEDDRATAELERRALRDAGRPTHIVGRVDEAVAFLLAQPVLLALIDYRLPDGDALRVLDQAQVVTPSVPAIVITGMGDERIVVEVLRRGAADYVIKKGDFWEQLPNAVDRVLKLAAAEQANARLAAIVESSDDAIVGASREGLVTTWNTGAAKSFGFAAGKAQGQHLSRLFAPERRAEVPDLLRRVLGGTTVAQLETVWVDADETPRHVSLTLSPIKSRSGPVIGISAIARDITAQKKTETEIQLRLRQQAAIAVLGKRALESSDLAGLMRETVQAVTRGLETDSCEILELQPDGRTFVVREGTGWAEAGGTGRSVGGEGPDSMAAYALSAGRPVIVDDLRGERRFPGSTWLRARGISSALAVPIRGRHRTYGVIETGTRKARAFSEDDTNHLQAVANVLGAALDRAETAEGLRSSEERFRQIAESISEVFYMTDAKTGAVLYVSPACERIWGQSQARILASPAAWMDSIHPDDRQRVGDAFTEKADTGGFDEIFRLRLADGRIRWARSRAFVIRNKQGEIYRYTGIAGDITDLKLAQDALVEKAALSALAAEVGAAHTRGDTLGEILRACTEAMVRHLGAAFARIWTLNAQEKVLELQASSGMYTHLDGPHSRVPVGEHKIGLIAQERAPHLTNDVQNDPRVGDHEWARREGMVSFAGYPLMVQDELVGVMAMFARAPLTRYALDGLGTVADTVALGIKRKMMEQARASLENQLRQAQKMEAIGRLAGGVAHDFNNLLTAILGYGELLLGRFDEADPGRQSLQEILKAGERAAKLTNQLLAFSRKQVLQPKILDLNALAIDLEKMLRRLIGEDIQLATSLEKNLGQVKADPGQIEQVIMNLVVNSRDAMPAGGKVTIETANVTLDETYAHRHLGAKAGRYVQLAVTDTGIGMDAVTQSRIFEPFFTTKEEGKGTGLGLATVYGIIKQSEGYIAVYSEPGHGTTFKIYLPRTDQPAERASAGRRAPLPRGTETILVVEDEESVRRLTRLILETQGYAVIEAPSGPAALVAAEKHAAPIHLVLTDVIMPEMNGRDLAQRIAKIRPSARIVFMSGYTGDTIVRHGVLEAGIAFLQKPFTPADLARKIREVLDGASSPPGA